MEFEIVWTEPAVADLEAIIGYIRRRNPSAADRLAGAIVQHVELLRSFPFIGPVYARDRRGKTREILCKKIRIFYRVDVEANQVHIVTLWHASRDEPDLPS